jgi:hypothetical protein
VSWQRISRAIAANRPLAELRAAFRRTEIVALDLDQCIFPGFTQASLGARVAGRLLRRPARARDRRFLPRLLLGGIYVALMQARRLFGRETAVERLVARYERVMRDIPEPYLADAASEIPRHSYPFAAETVAELAAQAPTGIISLGLDVVARAYAEAFRTEGSPSLRFFDANVVVFRVGSGGDRVFARYDRATLLLSGEDKRRALEGRMRESGARVPTTVGHSGEDVPLARLARERGGLAIGFNPSPGLEEAFDVLVTGRDWEPMYALVAMLAGARG